MFVPKAEAKRPCPCGTDKPLHSRKLGGIQLDSAKLTFDLAAIETMAGNNAYGRYNATVDARVPGVWEQIMLGNKTGRASDGFSSEYDGHFQWTEEGQKVPYVRSLVETVFRCEYIKSIRIFRAVNAIIAAHRDYMEFKNGFTRIHVVLRTNAHSMNSEASAVYQMTPGGIYFLDGREAHAGGNFSASARREHLVIDFDPAIPLADLFLFPEHDLTGGEMELVSRPVLSIVDLDTLINAWAAVMTRLNYGLIVATANLLPFTHEFDTAAVYDVVVEAALRSGNLEVINMARDDRRYFLGIE